MTTLNEGGHAFPEVNSVVPKPLLDANIKNALKLAGFNGLPFEVVGNKLKDFFGDIDIATDVEDIVKFLGLSKKSSKEEFFAALNQHLEKTSVPSRVFNGFSQFHLLVPLVDKSGKQLNAFDANGKELRKPGLIQIDVFVGNLGWMKGITSGAPIESKYKASYRNVLLRSIFHSLVFPTKDPNIFERYVLNFRDGFRKDIVQKKVTKTGNVKYLPISSKPVSASPDKLASFLFGPRVKWKDIESFEKLKALFYSDKFKYPQFREEIKQDFSKEGASLPQGAGPLTERIVRRARPKVYFDLDNTLSDYDGQLARMGMKPKDTIDSVDFWATADVLPGAKELFEFAMKHFDVEVLTASPKTIEAHTGKKLWVAKNLGSIPEHITRSGKEKTAFASPNAILIDDKKENVAAFVKAGGLGILATSPQQALRELKKMTTKKITKESLDTIIRSVLKEQVLQRDAFEIVEELKTCLRRKDWESCKALVRELGSRLEGVQ